MAWIRIHVPNFEAEQSLVEFVSQTDAYEHKFNLKINHGLASIKLYMMTGVYIMDIV